MSGENRRHAHRRHQSTDSAAQMARVEKGKPETYGGAVKGDQKSFPTISPVPSISPTTRILALCGIEPIRATILKDGWFISDFLYMHNLLRGCGKTQKWLLSKGMEPKEIVKMGKTEMGPYLHGNPHQTRKVVINDEMVRSGMFSDIIAVPEKDLKDEFLKTLSLECEQARKTKENVLVMIFTHGNDEKRNYSLDMPGNKEIIQAEFDKASGSGNRLTLLLTACHSGQWTMRQSQEMSILAAAGPKAESASWLRGPSMRGWNGGVYITAVAETLLQYAVPAPGAKENVRNLDTSNPRNDDTYAELTRNIHETLHLHVDREAEHHDIRFSAQNDEWGSPWPYMTGIPPSDFRKNLEAMPDYPPSELSDPNEAYRNQSPYAIFPGDEPDPDFDLSLGRKYGGSTSSFRRGMVKLSQEYFAKKPGRDNAASNTAVHGPLQHLLRGGHVPYSDLKELRPVLLYRIGLMAEATEMVTESGVPLPNGESCEQFDADKWSSWATNQYPQMKDKIYAMVHDAGILVAHFRPVHGTQWNFKPLAYLVASLCEAYKTESPASAKPQIRAKLEWMKRVRDQSIKQDVETALASRSVKETLDDLFKKTQQVFQRERSQSPTKSSSSGTRSRAQSVTERFKRLSMDSTNQTKRPGSEG